MRRVSDRHPGAPQKPKFLPFVTYDTLLAVIAIIFTGTGVYVALERNVATAMEKAEAIDNRQNRMEQRIDRRLDSLHSDVQDIKNILIGRPRERE